MRAYTIFPYDPLRNFETFYIEFDPECKHISLPHDENVEETIFVIEGELTMKLKEEEIQLKKDKRSVFSPISNTPTKTRTIRSARSIIRSFTKKGENNVRTKTSWKNTYYIESPAKIGIYVTEDSSVYLIDSGNDKEAPKK